MKGWAKEAWFWAEVIWDLIVIGLLAVAVGLAYLLEVFIYVVVIAAGVVGGLAVAAALGVI